MRLKVLMIAFLALGGSLASTAQVRTSQVKRNQGLAVIAALVRYVTLGTGGIVFLEVNGKDPSIEVLQDLSAWHVRVLPRSRAVYVPSDDLTGIGGFKDRESGEPGRYFSVENIKWLDNDRAEISAGWYQPCGTYTLTKQKGVWAVSKYKAWEICF